MIPLFLASDSDWILDHGDVEWFELWPPVTADAGGMWQVGYEIRNRLS